MKSRANFRLMAFVVLVVLVVGLAAQNSLAQATVSVSPVALSYGVPTGTPVVSPCTVPCSAQETVTVNIIGASTASPVTFGSTTVTGTNYTDFITAGDSCTGQKFTSPATCLVTLYFNASYAGTVTPTKLETATLTLSVTSGATAPPPIPLSGAYGSIKLFGETNVATPPSSTSFTNLYTIASTTQNLSCTGTVTATLSGTPDGVGNLLVDDYITLATGSPLTPANDSPPYGDGTLYPLGNVCSGAASTAVNNPNPPDEGDYQSCFTSDYQFTADNYPNTLIGLDPDTFTSNGNTAILGKLSSNAGGIAPINISSFFSASYSGQALFTLLSSGSEGLYANSTLFLQTSCSPGGVVPGATVTGNPTPTNTVSFDSNPGTSCSILDNNAQNPQTPGTTPVYTEIAVPQQLFYQLVQGTSAAPDVCTRVSCEQDSSNNNAPMCAGILVQCWDPTHTTLNGANCDAGQMQSLLRNTLFSFSFDSPDTLNGSNYLYNSSPNACTYYLGGAEGAACATGTGPGLLVGGDAWACAPGSTEPCTPLEPSASGFNTTTSAATPIYVTSTILASQSADPNCYETGLVANDLCPLDLLTQFRGAADIPPTGDKGNSIYFPVVNHPLPTASATVGQYGWVNSTTANVNFAANAATYSSPSVTANNPFPSFPYNGFVAAPVYSVTYGITQAGSPLPDTTYPVPGDITVWNNYTQENFANPLCNYMGTTPSSFSPTESILSLTASQLDGLYNLHYYPTDCALTEGLNFNPQPPVSLTDPTVNWASFPFVTFGIDTVAPTFSSASCSPAPGTGTWYGGPSGNLTVTCTVNDPPAADGSYSGFMPVSGIQGKPNETVSIYTNVAPGYTDASATAGAQSTPAGCCTSPPALTVTDLAGNPVAGGVSAGPYQIDLQAPTISGSAGSSTVGGTAITVTFTCSDAGSGVPSGGCTISSGAPGNYVANSPACNPSSGATVTCGGTIPTTVAEGGTLYVSATDNVGNQAQPYPVAYSVGKATASIAVTNVSPSSENYGQDAAVTITAVLSWTGSGTAPTATNVTIGGNGHSTYGLTTCGTPSGDTMTCTATYTPNASDTPGTYTETATFAADSNYSGSSSTQTNNFSITQQTTSVNVTGVSVPSEAYGSGTPTTVTATLAWTGGGAAPTGGLTFASTAAGSYGAVNCTGTSTPITCTATFTPTATDALGTYTLSASYVATTNYSGSSSTQTNNFSITQQTTSVNVTGVSVPSEAYGSGTPTTVTATLAWTGGGAAPTGGLTFASTAAGSYGAVNCTGTSTPITCTATFTPTATDALGTYTLSASYVATTNYSGSSSTQTNNFSITQPPTWTITPSIYAFPLSSVGQSPSMTFTVHNPTATPTKITWSIPGSGNENAKGDPDDYGINANGCTTAPAYPNTCNVTVTWTPDTDDLPLYPGGSAATLQVNNSSTKAILAQANMTGVAEDPTVSVYASGNALISPYSYNFGSTTGTEKETFTLTNNGPTPLFITRAITISNSRYFTLSANSCSTGTPISSGNSCTFSVTFTPPSSGTTVENATVTITDNAVTSAKPTTISPQTISLSGAR